MAKKIVIDVEADGPAPGLYSMVSFGAVILEDGEITKTFYGKTKPLEGAKWIPEALAVSGHTREEHESFDDPAVVMQDFENWLKAEAGYIPEKRNTRPHFYSDNNGFDYQWINYYFVLCLGNNPFGHTSRNINDLYKGFVNDLTKNGKHLRKTRHTHHPVDDARGNAEIIQAMKKQGLRIGFK